MTPRKAYSAVRMAMKNGALIRPEKCSRCNCIPKPAIDGRSSIHAHHHDYDKPLDVEWICAKCHRKETRLPKIMGAPNYGENNGYSKLKEQDVLEIRSSNETDRVLAKKFGVCHTTIGRARNRTYWKAAAQEYQGE